MLAIIGGSSAYRLLAEGKLKGERMRPIHSLYGPSEPLYRLEYNGRRVLFLSRHGGKDYTVSAPFINYRANVYALKEAGVTQIIAWSGSNAIDTRYAVGQYVLPSDVIDETRRRPSTFFPGVGWGYIRQNPVFCPTIRNGLAQALTKLKLRYDRKGTCVCSEGPRLETAAEIRKYSIMGGHLASMTLCPEAFLARELEMCYAPVCSITSYAEGVRERPDLPDKLLGGLATDDELEVMQAAVDNFPRIIETFCTLHDDIAQVCTCGTSMQRYKIDGAINKDWHTWIRDDTES